MTPSGRARLGAAGFSLATASLLGVAAAASVARTTARRDEAAVVAVVSRLPSADLALSGGARWLRAPSMVEPGAPFDVGPALLDPDPAGGLLAPPRDVFSSEAAR